MTYGIVLFLCRLFLVVDILITTMAVAGRYISFILDPAWSEEVILTCMSCTAVLSAALAIRRGTRTYITALDRYLPAEVVRNLDIIADLAVLVLAVVMITVGWKYAAGIGSKGIYVNTPKVSKFWMYFPAPLVGAAMLVLEIETLYSHVKSFFVRERME